MKFRPTIVFSILLLTWIGGTFVAAQKLSVIEYRLTGWLPSLFPLIDISSVIALLILSFISSFLLLIGSRPVYALIALLIPWLSFTYSAAHLPKPDPDDVYWLKDWRFVEIVATVKSQKNKYNTVIEVHKQTYPVSRKLSGTSLLILPRFKANSLSQGTRLIVQGRVKPLKKVKFAWQLDKRTYLRKNGIYSKFQSISIEKIPIKIIRDKNNIENFRELIIKKHRSNIGDKKGDLLSSIVLGDRAVNLEYNLKKSFQKTGLSHLLAASGFNLSILVGSIYLASSLFTKSKPLVAATALGAILGFVSLAGTSPSVLRAAIMSSVFVLSTMSFRRTNTLALLSFTLFCFSFFKPASLLDVGLQLSFAATFSIVIGINKFSPKISGLNFAKPVKWLLELTVVILLAQAAVLPIQLFYFWELGFFFLVANLIVDPVVAPITVCGFVSSILIMLSQVVVPMSDDILNCARLADQLVYYPIEYMIMVAEQLGSFEGASICLGPPFLWNIFLYYISFLFFVESFDHKAFLPISICLFSFSLSLFFLKTQSKSCLIVSKNHLAIYDLNSKKVFSTKSKDFNLNRFLKYNGISPTNIEELNLLPGSKNKKSSYYDVRTLKIVGIEPVILKFTTPQTIAIVQAKFKNSRAKLIPLNQKSTRALLKSNQFKAINKPTIILTKCPPEKLSLNSKNKKLCLVKPGREKFIKIEFESNRIYLPIAAK